MPSVHVGGLFELGHHVLGQGPRQQLGALGVVLGEEHRGGGQGVVPAVLPNGLEEVVDQADELPVGLLPADGRLEIGEVALQHRPVDLHERVDADGRGGEELGEPGDRHHAFVGLAGSESGAQAPAHPTLGEVLQPRLRDAVEPQVGVG
ncbi:hypothetical protein ACGFX8_34470 [Streptomyces sp. NPDC048362]|uniref:hypothetical protein n=1 Tax=Streptomyces sp. NPDC048362 TaxID=3365539 RepID=UPI00371B086A